MEHEVVETEVREQDGQVVEYPVAVISTLDVNNRIYNRLFFKPCGHVECAERFEMVLN